MAEPNHEKQILEQALDIASAEDRAAFVREACGGDESRVRRICALLRASEAPAAFLPEQPGNSATDPGAADLEAPGSVIGRYKLLEQIGEGGFGVVFMAEQLEPVRRRVALKIIKPGMDSRQVIGRFEAERQALAMMEHPNIAKVLDAGTTDVSRPYFVMELVRGIRITDYCDQAQCSTKERLDLFIKVCRPSSTRIRSASSTATSGPRTSSSRFHL